jgi:predicted CXXCH cytochrome family protein
VSEGNSVCFTCHPDKQDGLKTRKVAHQPVKQSCVQCHNPHGSPNKAMLSAVVPALCSNCHPNEASLTEKAITRHGPMMDAKTCMNCHDPHFSDNARLLPMPQMELCLKCHDKPLDTERGRIMDMKTLVTAKKNGHGPIKQKDCVSCHNPHGSDYWRILVKYYPADFYTSYAAGKYGICFSCHDKSAFSSLKTEEATGFRNGDRNLHFLHVNKASKGRTCRACHEVHADAGAEHHIKERIRFSGWSMPMNFSPTKNGGSCAPGCHGEKTYSR